MYNFILALLLAGMCGGAAAEWVAIGSNDTSTFYADPATIRSSGEVTRMWDMIDEKNAKVTDSGKRYMSSKGQNEYDCHGVRMRLLYTSYHSANMGEGEIVFSEPDPGGWVAAPPGSGIGTLWKIACSKQ
jgi:hypothetical protein